MNTSKTISMEAITWAHLFELNSENPTWSLAQVLEDLVESAYSNLQTIKKIQSTRLVDESQLET